MNIIFAYLRLENRIPASLPTPSQASITIRSVRRAAYDAPAGVMAPMLFKPSKYPMNSFMLYAIVGAVIAGFVGSSTSSQCSTTTTAERPRPP
jgi:hypothetical protein